MDRVIAIYARENGQGMAFPVPVPTVSDDGVEPAVDAQQAGAPAATEDAVPRGGIQLVPSTEAADEDGSSSDDPPPSPPARKRPALKRVK